MVGEAKKKYLEITKEENYEGEYTLSDVSKIKVIKTEDHDVVVAVNKGEDLKKRGIFFWTVKDNRFKKVKFDIFSLINKDLFNRDSFFSSEKTDYFFFSKMLKNSIGCFHQNVIDILFFISPSFEKFLKIYIFKDGIIHASIKGIIASEWEQNLGLFLNLLSSDKDSEYTLMDKIFSNEKLSSLGFSKKRNTFLHSLIQRDSVLNIDLRSIRNLSLLNEIEKKRKESKYGVIGVDFFEDDFRIVLTKDIEEMERCDEITKYTYSPLKRNQSIYFSCGARGESLFEIFEIAKKNNQSISDIMKYLRSAHEDQFMGISDVVNYYKDYLIMSYDMYDSFEKYPSRLRFSHDKLVGKYNEFKMATKNEEENKTLEKRFNELLFLNEEAVGENHLIIVPKTVKEIVSEGNSLSHCVASYSSKVAQNETTILFIRNKERKEKPLYTAEVKGGKIVQMRGKANSRVPEEIETLFKKKLKELISGYKIMRKGA